MPRQRSPNRDKAFLIYKEYNGNIKLKDIAAQLNVSDSQVRKWKSADKWEQKLKGTLPLKSNVTNKNKCDKKEPMQQEVKEVLDNPELTEKQRLFCVYYPKCFNATKAAIKAGYSKNRASEIGYQLLQKTTVKEEIQRLKQNKLNRAMLSSDDIFQRYLDIAYACITDYVKFGQRSYKVKDKKGKKKIIKYNYVDLNESTQIDGSLISEIKEGKNGVSIKLADKMKALQWLSDRTDLLSTETKEKIKIEKEKLKIATLKTKEDPKDETIEDDGFIDALKGTAQEDWKDEET